MNATILIFIVGFVTVPLFADDVTPESMKELGRQAASGNTHAIDQIEQVYDQLYKGIDYQNDLARVNANRALMNAAFDEMAVSVKGDKPDDPAFQSLLYATTKPKLVRFTPMAFGRAAAGGHEPSLEVLLNYSQHGILLSSAVLALQKAAENDNKKAVEFLVGVLNNQAERPLWLEASQELAPAANQGDNEAKQALANLASPRASQ
jgi:hypothetical protein